MLTAEQKSPSKSFYATGAESSVPLLINQAEQKPRWCGGQGTQQKEGT